MLRFCKKKFQSFNNPFTQSDLLRGVLYCLYLYSISNICTLWLNKKKYDIRIPQPKNWNVFIKNKLIVNY